MSFVIIQRTDIDEELSVFGPFDNLGQVDDWQDKFCHVDYEYQITEITLEPVEFKAFKNGVAVYLELKYNLFIEDPTFDWLGYWQAGVEPMKVAEILRERALGE